ncbi:MAG: lytic murein transglycosylase [Campylobacterales bacterium]|nr:lytic murein transglycosylase [Campylobacterales bacterium]
MLQILVILMLPFILLANEDRPPIPYDFLAKKEAQQFIRQMVKKHDFESSDLKRLLEDAKLDRDTLARYTGRYRKNTTVGSWQRFKAHVLDPDSLEKAEKFKKKYARILKKAEEEYHVDAEYIVGFIGVESKFGEYTGEYRLLDSLATLAFHKNRMQKFFRSELEHFFLMCREEGFDPCRLKGSFAGAMGVVQQIPSVYRKYGMDYNGDGKKDPWSAEDGIGIIARFMHKNGWKEDAQVAVRADYKGKRYKGLKTGYKTSYTLSKLRSFGITPKTHYRYTKARLIKLTDKASDELWLGAPNFRILIRYNPSSDYAMAIHKIAQHIRHTKGSDTFFQRIFD